MDKRSSNKVHFVKHYSSGKRCQLCEEPTFNVCIRCAGHSFNKFMVRNVLKSSAASQEAGAPKEERPQAAFGVGKSEFGFREFLRGGSKMLESVSKNVTSAKDQLFGSVSSFEEEDIDSAVEEYKLRLQMMERQDKN